MYFAGNKCALSRNGMLCRHETTCSTRNAVRRSMIKTFLLEEIHVEGVSLETNMY